jgi:hypothetical protein
VLAALEARRILSLSLFRERTGLPSPAATSAMDLLVHSAVAREPTSDRRNRHVVYDRWLAMLNESIETQAP